MRIELMSLAYETKLEPPPVYPAILSYKGNTFIFDCQAFLKKYFHYKKLKGNNLVFSKFSI